MEKVLYNEESFIEQIVLGRYESEQTDKMSIPYIFSHDLLHQYLIINDLFEPFLKLELIVETQGDFFVSNYPQDGRTFIRIYIQKEPPKQNPQGSAAQGTVSQDKPTVKNQSTESNQQQESSDQKQNIIFFDHLFLVNDIQVLSIDGSSATYKIIGISNYYPLWESKSWYSTKGKELPLTQVIEDLLTNVKKFPFKKNQNLQHTSNKYFYISEANNSIKEDVECLLLGSHNEKEGVFTFYYNTIENTCKLISINQLYEDDKLQPYNAGIIPTNHQFAASEQMMFFDSSSSLLESIKSIDHASTIKLNTFDYLKREYNVDNKGAPQEINYDMIKKMLPRDKKSVQNKEISFQDVVEGIKNIGNFEYQFAPVQYCTFSKRLANIVRFFDVLSFKCLGYLKRNPGQLYRVLVAEGSGLKYRYSGIWVISRVQHLFSKDTYLQNLNLIRNDRLKRKPENSSENTVLDQVKT